MHSSTVRLDDCDFLHHIGPCVLRNTSATPFAGRRRTPRTETCLQRQKSLCCSSWPPGGLRHCWGTPSMESVGKGRLGNKRLAALQRAPRHGTSITPERCHLVKISTKATRDHRASEDTLVCLDPSCLALVRRATNYYYYSVLVLTRA